MAVYRTGEMFSVYTEADLFCVTTNSYIRKDEMLTMGKGAAKQLRDRLSERQLRQISNRVQEEAGHLGIYGFLPIGQIGLFQTKKSWRYKSSAYLITRSTYDLHRYAIQHPDEEIHMNYPGIGNGGLHVREVEPIIEPLPDNVHIWRHQWPERSAPSPPETD